MTVFGQTVETTLPRLYPIISQILKLGFFILINFDGHGDYVRDRSRDHNIDNDGFSRFVGRRDLFDDCKKSCTRLFFDYKLFFIELI